jgi:hypothetical protein
MPVETAARRPYQPRPHRRERRTSSGIPLPRAADGRSVRARRFRDLVVAFELEVGGILTESERAMIKQAAALSREVATMPDLLMGRNNEPDTIPAASSHSLRALTRQPEPR